MPSSRIPGFYRLSLSERRLELSRRTEIQVHEFEASVGEGGLSTEAADKVVENVLGTYSLPFGVALNFSVNGRDRLIPMVVEEPSVIAAASNAARIVRGSGGFEATMLCSLMSAQVQLFEVTQPERAAEAIHAATEELLALGQRAVPNLVARGGGPHSLQVRDLGAGYLVVHVLVDCRDAMGANLVNTVAEALGPRIHQLAGGQLGLRILTNLCDERRVRVTCRAHTRALTGAPAHEGRDVISAIVQASEFAWRDPYRAATHNKGLMNGVDAVVLATGNDFRAVEAGVHAFAAHSGCYRPVSRWTREGDELVGVAEFPLALGIVGGTLGVHPAARLALRVARVVSAADLCELAASAGLASNLAALRALATEGIQRGHMSLHARALASSVGARGDEVEQVAASLADARSVTREAAERVLQILRGLPALES